MTAPAMTLAQIPGDAQETVPLSIPIYKQFVVIGVPTGWKPSNESRGPRNYRMELIPADQTNQNQREMITVQGFEGLAKRKSANARDLIDLVQSQVRTKCKDDFIGPGLLDGEPDSVDVSIAFFGCGKSMESQQAGPTAGRSEVAVYVALKGTDDMYLIRRSFRSEPTVSNAFTRQQIDRWLASLQPIRLCDRNDSQAKCWEKAPQR